MMAEHPIILKQYYHRSFCGDCGQAINPYEGYEDILGNCEGHNE